MLAEIHKAFSTEQIIGNCAVWVNLEGACHRRYQHSQKSQPASELNSIQIRGKTVFPLRTWPIITMIPATKTSVVPFAPGSWSLSVVHSSRSSDRFNFYWWSLGLPRPGQNCAGNSPTLNMHISNSLLPSQTADSSPASNMPSLRYLHASLTTC